MSMLTSQNASREYASRPKDERFPSLESLVSNAKDDRQLSGERTYNLRDLRMVADESANTLRLASTKGEAKLTHWSFGQLARMVDAPASYLRDLPVQLAADCLNHGINAAPFGSSVNLLVRAPNGDPTPTIRSANSESYGRVWDDLYGSIAHQLTSHDSQWTLPPTWTGESAGAYRGDRDSFLILTNGGSIVTDPSLSNRSGVGSSNGPTDGMYRGILVRNSEVGAAKIVIERILFRFVCGNHMLWGAIADRTYSRRHIGTAVLRDTIREIAKLAYDWGQASTARDTAIIRALIDHEVAATKEAIVDELRAMGATKDQAVSAFESCEKHEAVSPRSFWGLAQGLTRESQESGFQDDRFSGDKLAAALLLKGARQYAYA